MPFFSRFRLNLQKEVVEMRFFASLRNFSAFLGLIKCLLTNSVSTSFILFFLPPLPLDSINFLSRSIALISSSREIPYFFDNWILYPIISLLHFKILYFEIEEVNLLINLSFRQIRQLSINKILYI